jgi:uncharacterized phage protein gp47/JayE
MGYDGADYTADSANEIYERIVGAVRTEFDGEVEPSPYSLVQSILLAQAETRAENQEQSLQSLNDDAYLATATGEALDRKAAEKGIQRRPATQATGVVEFSRQTNANSDYVIPSGTVVQTEDGSVQFRTTEKTTIEAGTTTATANAEAVEGGPDGNLGANRLVAMPSKPTGVGSVTNPDPTGDDDFTDTDGNPLVPGRPRESDRRLRERAQSVDAIGGAATHDAIETRLTERDTVVGLTVYRNKTDSTQNGLPPHSFEAVVYAPSASDGDIARDIFETKAVTDTDVGGVNGTEVTYTVDSSVLATGGETIHFSRAPNIAIDVDITVVHTDEYAGKDAVKDAIVKYVGGTDTSGTRRIGTTVGEDVYVPRLRDAVVGTDTGVLGVSSLTLDTNDDGGDDTMTDTDGLNVISVASNEVAVVDAANITVTEDPQG